MPAKGAACSEVAATFWEVMRVWFSEERVGLLILDIFEVSPFELPVPVVSVFSLSEETILGWASAVIAEVVS